MDRMVRVSRFSILSVGFWFIVGVAVTPLVWAKPSTDGIRADPRRLRSDVEKLSVAFHPRDSHHPDNMAGCANYVRAQFLDAGAFSVTVQAFKANGGNKYRNVCALFGEAEGPRTVVGAHYDSEVGTPGADDNASGVAGILEFARLVGKHPIPGNVEVVAYALEEAPYFGSAEMGSMVHAKSLKDRGIMVRRAIILETIGYYSDLSGSQTFPDPALKALYPDTGNYIALVGRLDQYALLETIKAKMKTATDLPVYSVCAPATVVGIDFSDHRSYWEYGFPALMVTDTAFYRNPHYHKSSDTSDRLDYARMAKVVEGVYGAIAKWPEVATGATPKPGK
jgi:hypothetical protein